MQTNNKAFSLIELVIVVGLISILTTVAMPKFKAFQAKAKMSEAKVTLTHIATLQEAYAMEHTTYATMPNATTWYGFQPLTGASACTDPTATALGLTIEPCDAKSPRFSYNILANSSKNAYYTTANSGKNKFNRVVSARKSKPSKFTINEKRMIEEICNVLTQTSMGDLNTGCDDNGRTPQ